MRVDRHLVGIIGLTGLLLAASAAAAPCAGFGDVDTTNAFCPNVEWLKNRKVTLGCTTTQYCPDAAVSRLAMAAFMNRLGTALTPNQVRVEASPGAIDLDAQTVVCKSQPFVAADFPRRAYLDVSFSGLATVDIDLVSDIVMTTDGGISWNTLSPIANRGWTPANKWGGFSDIAYVDLDVGQITNWGIRVVRAGGTGGTTDLSASRCVLRATIYSRDGTSSPY